MNYLKFEWDESKNTANQKKHGISFDEAKTVFYDKNARLIPDPDHSAPGEDRFILLGFSSILRMLVVVHTYRKNDEIIRIISARKATKKSQRFIKKVNNMREEYDFSDSVKNPYYKKLKKQITIRIENETIDYFKQLAAETDIPYQKLINLFLRDCAQNKLKPSITWKTS